MIGSSGGITAPSPPKPPMSLSSRLQTKVNANRAQREALAAKNQSFLNRCFAVGLALGLGGGVLAIVAGMRQVASSAATRVVTPIAAPVAPPEPHNEFHNPSNIGQKLSSEPLVGNPNPFARCDGATKVHSGCSPEQTAANDQAYWAEQDRREAENRADCRAGIMNRSTCDRLVPNWETRI